MTAADFGSGIHFIVLGKIIHGDNLPDFTRNRIIGITHFNRGFRFLGVEFIRSLVFKSKNSVEDDQFSTHIIKPVPVVPPPEPDLEAEDIEGEPLTEMQLAFLQAVIKPGQFVQKSASLT